MHILKRRDQTTTLWAYIAPHLCSHGLTLHHYIAGNKGSYTARSIDRAHIRQSTEGELSRISNLRVLIKVRLLKWGSDGLVPLVGEISHLDLSILHLLLCETSREERNKVLDVE